MTAIQTYPGWTNSPWSRTARAALKLISPPEDMPITLEEAKAHLRVDHSEDDKKISQFIAAATGHVDGKYGYLQRALEPQTWELSYDEFPCGAIEMPLPPLISVESIKYIDENGDEQTIDAANYFVDIDSVPGWVVRASSFSWPSVMCTANAVRVRFICGFERAEPDSGQSEGQVGTSVPEAIRIAIMMMIGDWYENRETVSVQSVNEIPMATPVKALLSPYKIPVLA